MNHPLDGAYARLDRAMEHLVDLKTVLTEFTDSEHEIAARTAEIHPGPAIKPGDVPFKIMRPESPIPVKVSILVGEVVSNLRSALDYLIYELARLDSGSVQNGTQFPIEDKPTGFQGRGNSFLRGINDAHAAQIERLQPYNGVDWTRRLRIISNPDKHRHLSIHTHNTAIKALKTNDPAQAFPTQGDKGAIIVMKLLNPATKSTMYMQFNFTFYICFDDGTPVIQTLEELHSQVADTLTNFKPEF